MERSHAILLHLFSDRNKWVPNYRSKFQVLEVDITRNHDLLSYGVWSYDMRLARPGLVRGVVEGPPCNTFTRLRSSEYQDDGGPRRLRSRDGSSRYGLEGLTPKEACLVRDHNLLWMRTCILISVARATHEDTLVGVESPQDPAEMQDPSLHDQTNPNVWKWPAIMELMRILGLRLASFDQACLGHRDCKPTSMLVSSWSLFVSLHELRMPRRNSSQQGDSLEHRCEHSSSAATWAPGLVRCVLLAWDEFVRVPRLDRLRRAAEESHYVAEASSGMFDSLLQLRSWWAANPGGGQAPQEVQVKSGPGYKAYVRSLCKIRLGKDESSFTRHVLAGHLPYRRDCSICQRGAARARPKRARPLGWDNMTFSFDLSGPFVQAIQEDYKVHVLARYVLVGVYAMPIRQDGKPLWFDEGSPAEDSKSPQVQGSAAVVPDPESADESAWPFNLEGLFSDPGEGPQNLQDLEVLDCNPEQASGGLELEEGFQGPVGSSEGPSEVALEDGVDVAVEPPAEEDSNAVEASGRRWKELYEQRSEGILTRNLIFAEVLQNKKSRLLCMVLKGL